MQVYGYIRGRKNFESTFFQYSRLYTYELTSQLIEMSRQAFLVTAAVALVIAANTNAQNSVYAPKLMRDVLRPVMEDQLRTNSVPYSQSYKDMQLSLMEEQRTGISSAAARAMADQVSRALADDLQRSGVASVATRSLIDQVLKDSVEDRLKRSGVPSDAARSVAEQVLRSASMEDKMTQSGMSNAAARSVVDQVLRDSVEDLLKRTGLNNAAAHSAADQVIRMAAADDQKDDLTSTASRSVADKVLRTSMEDQLKRNGMSSAAAKSIADQVVRTALENKKSMDKSDLIRSSMENQRYSLYEKDARNYIVDDQDRRSGTSARLMADRRFRTLVPRQNQDDLM